MPGTRSRGTTSEPNRAKVVAVVQVRMGSTRLPGKALADLGGRPILEHVVRRVRRARTVDDVVVATTDRPADDAIASLCKRLGVRCYRGDEDDVLRRFLGALETIGADVVVRITADCPLVDPDVIDRVVRARARAGADYASNGIERSWPRGLDVEAFRVDALRAADRLARKPYEREHVTPAIYQHPDRFRLTNVLAPAEARAPEYRVCVDTAEDLEAVRGILAAARDPASLTSGDIVRILQSHPEIRALNAHVPQKAPGD